jgi:pectate lyase
MRLITSGVVATLFLCAAITHSASAYDSCPIGFAAVNSLGQNGTTGGGGNNIVTVTTKSDLAYYAGLSGSYTIYVSGTFTGAGDIAVTSDKSIIGLGSGATLNGFALTASGQHNIIIRNLTITNGVTDTMAFKTVHHAWVDHCDLSYGFDGLLDITYGSDYITISNTKFHNHDKCSLVNSGTNHFEDVGKCHVTYHHNWFDTTVQRNPRGAYGPIHVFNNYYTDVSSYCIGYHTGAKILAQNNYFLSCATPLNQMYSSDSTNANYGDCESVGNIFSSCSGNTTGTGTSFDPTVFYNYSFDLDTATSVPATTQANAGPQSGCDYVLVPTPGNGSVDYAASSPQLTWTNLPDVISWDIYFGTAASPAYQINQTSRTWTPPTLSANTTYYWRVDAVTSGGTVTGQVWQFRTAQATASKPFPAAGQTNTPRRVTNTVSSLKPMELSWTAGLGAVTHQLYFGTSASLSSGDLKGSLTSTTYAPGLLKSGTTYYWRVDTVKADSSVVAGTVWNFTTNPVVSAPVGRTEAENMARNGRYFLWQYGSFSGGYGVTDEAGPGSVCAYYTGTTAICDITVTYYDMSAGSTHYNLLINNSSVAQWDATVNTNMVTTNVTRTEVTTGDEICIVAYTDASEPKDLARIDCIDIAIAPGADDTYAPTPNPMTWAVAPYGSDYDSITMTASTATDISGVEYMFTCTSGTGGHSSAWQASQTYTDYSLPASTSPSTDYTYTVKARDKSANNNETSASTSASAKPTALTTSLVRINFQPSATRTPAGYLADSGGTYGAKSCGLSYGWNVSHSTYDRGTNPDDRLDTLAKFHMGGYWEIALPNGIYDVTVATGDTTASICTLNVEGASYWSFVAMNANNWVTKTRTVSVSDGRLTINNGAGGEESPTCICYVIIALKTTADAEAPEPNPMTWATAPRVMSDTAITMTATTAYDASGVEYMFTCTAGAGGHSSSWQSSPTYTDTGLNASTAYTYKVKARDGSAAHNETSYSSTSSATTLAAPDTQAPTPNPMKWAVAPHATGCNSLNVSYQIMMTAATAADATGVEYYFTCTSGGGHNSGWQDSTTYIDTGLTNGTTYTYTVTARDKGMNQNVGTASPAAGATAGSLLTPLVKVNYQKDVDAIPSGYVADYGNTYGDRGNGYSYGWNSDHTSTMRDYGTTADARLNTIVNFKVGAYWELLIANGLYDVEATIGDGVYDRSGYILNVEGVNYWNNTNLLKLQFRTQTRTVTVSDGRLTIDNGAAGDSDVRLCYVIITPVTAADTTSPTPATMTWATAPYAISSSSIAMAATTASDSAGVQYYFACTAGGGHDSGWQIASTYTDTGLVNNATYTYKVKARDKSINNNENAYSNTASATTPRYSCTAAASDRNTDCQVDFLDFALQVATWTGSTANWASLQQFADQWLTCNRAPSSECWQ